MVQSDQNHYTSSAGYILFDIEPLRNLEQNCLDDVVACIARWLGRNHELMYTNAWNFTFTPEVPGQSEDLSTRLHVKDRLDKEALERFHGLKSTTHKVGSSSEALPIIIQRTLEAGSPVVLGINSFWVPWDDGYQQRERTHSCIVVGCNPYTQDLYCTDPYFMQKGVLLPRADFLKGYLFCETFNIVADESHDLFSIVDAIIDCLQNEIAGNRPFLQMRDLANTFSTSFQVPQKTDLAADTLEISLFVKLTSVADARIKSSQMFTYLGNTYDARFLAYAERLKKLSSQWRIVGAKCMKMQVTSRWSNDSLQKVALQILTISVEEQTLAYELLAFLESFRQSDNDDTVTLRAIDLSDHQKVLDDNHNEYIAPRTTVEAQIVELWKEVLEVERVGIQDNFFELGGQSLKAVSLLSRMGQQLNQHIPISLLFQYPTVQELARYVADQQAEHTSTQREAIFPTTSLENTCSSPVMAHDLHASIRPRPPAQPKENCIASFAQQRLWLLDQLYMNSSPYYLLHALRLEGALDVVALQHSLNEIARRHEALRTTFFQHAEAIFQHITPAASVPLPLVGLQRLSPAEQETEIRLLAQQESQAFFDLHQGSLWRPRLLRLGDQQHILLLAFHHIVTDGWSLDVFTRELIVLYQALHAEQPVSLPELPIQYADYALWQRQQLRGEILEHQVEYWKHQLSGVTGALELPYDYPHPPRQTFRGAAQQAQISATLAQALKQLSQREGVTLFMTLLAAFQMLLYRYSGQSDITVGTPTANRTHPETEHLIGFFVNTLALRTDLSGNPSVQEILRRVKTTALGAYEHQELPFEQVVEALQPERTLSHNPLFQVFFVLQNIPEHLFSLPGLQMENLNVEQQTAEFDLILLVEETSTSLQVTLEYKADLFAEITIRNFLEHYQMLLQGIVTDPVQVLDTLPLLTPREREQILHEWNSPLGERSRTRCFHEVFQEHALRSPDTVALVFEEEYLTYRELNGRANQLAHYLQSLGVEPEHRVILFTERSPDAIVGMLAILKAGGIYVPIDPSYPGERIAFLFQDTEATALITQQRLVQRLPEHHLHIVSMDTQREILSQQSTENPVNRATLENGAYMIYTSGSTGKPKGVLVEHRNLISFLQANQQRFQLHAGDIVPCFASFSFDGSLLEVLSPLFVGGISSLFTREQLLDLDTLVTKLDRMTIIYMVPSLMREVVRRLKENRTVQLNVEHIRMIWIGGEAVPPDLLLDLQEIFRSAHVYVLYGPTEGTILCSSYLAPRGESIKHYPIGSSLPGILLTIRDKHQQLVPVGVPGELYIEGDTVARGYFKREELTSKAFLTLEHERCYKTGDLARYRHDGVIEFLGRIDTQVKIRGFRIELGEVEEALADHPAVQESVVLAQQYAANDTRLIAYVVPIGMSSEALIADIRHFLQRKLPDYMLPSSVHVLDAMPLLPNGKVALQALPAPQTTHSMLETGYVAPHDATEKALVEIWSQVLDRENIGVEDDFFALGGHSLLAFQVISRIRSIFGLDLTLLGFFEEPTITSLALSINQSLKKPEVSPIDAEHIRQSVDQLSDEEVDSLLNELLADEEGVQ